MIESFGQSRQRNASIQANQTLNALKMLPKRTQLRDTAGHTIAVNRLNNTRLRNSYCSKMEKCHFAFQLLRKCLGVCKVNYFLRTIPTTASQKGAEAYDTLMEGGLRSIAGNTLDHHRFWGYNSPSNRNAKILITWA